MDIHPALIEAGAKAWYEGQTWSDGTPASLTWAATSEDVRERMRVAQRVALRAVFAVKAPCETCGGTGEGESRIDQGASLAAGAPIRVFDSCSVCGGSGESTLPLHITETMEPSEGHHIVRSEPPVLWRVKNAPASGGVLNPT